jgi:hypothetical protein
VINIDNETPSKNKDCSQNVFGFFVVPKTEKKSRKKVPSEMRINTHKSPFCCERSLFLAYFGDGICRLIIKVIIAKYYNCVNTRLEITKNRPKSGLHRVIPLKKVIQK